jgi:hypothetical protein
MNRRSRSVDEAALPVTYIDAESASSERRSRFLMSSSFEFDVES